MESMAVVPVKELLYVVVPDAKPGDPAGLETSVGQSLLPILPVTIFVDEPWALMLIRPSRSKTKYET